MADLLRRGANVNFRDPSSSCPSVTPLILAAKLGSPKACALLLAAGANKDARDEVGRGGLGRGRTTAATMAVDGRHDPA